jgi:hypothetical protein
MRAQKLTAWAVLALHRIASAIDAPTDDLHLVTDPACEKHRSPRDGSRLDRASRGVSCTPCMVRGAFGYSEWGVYCKACGKTAPGHFTHCPSYPGSNGSGANS